MALLSSGSYSFSPHDVLAVGNYFIVPCVRREKASLPMRGGRSRFWGCSPVEGRIKDSHDLGARTVLLLALAIRKEVHFAYGGIHIA